MPWISCCKKHPELSGTFHFLQVGAPSRMHFTAYRDLTEEVTGSGRADQLGARHRTLATGGVPQRALRSRRDHLLYRMAAGCVVSSLHDGMNLVAKEFVAARDDERGVLVLSRFTGAAPRS